MTHTQESFLALFGYFFPLLILPAILLIALITWIVWRFPRVRIPFVIVLAITLSWNFIFPPIKSDNALYLVLTEILDERARLWKLPPSEGRTREYDISDLVCPLVSESSLSEMYEATKTITAGPRVNYNYIANGQGVVPDGAGDWSLVRRRMFHSELLFVWLKEPDYCYARFQFDF